VLPGKKYSLEEIARLVWRRKWLVLLPFAVGLAGAVVLARDVPQRYMSETLIMVVPQRVSSDLVKPNDVRGMEDRLPSISEQIQTRSRLERIINEFNLYPEARASGVMEDVVKQMRDNIVVRLEGKTQEAFRVSFVSSDPVTAQKVTERLASWYIDENLRDKERFAISTNQFLDSELENAKRRLMEHEKKLEAYRRRYSGQLPSQLESNLQSMQNAQQQLQAVSDSLNRATERRLLFERQLADAQSTPELPTVPPSVVSGPQDVTQLPPVQQLELATAALDRARLRYTSDHPDIRALERTIRDLRAKLAEDVTAAPDAQPQSAAEVLRQKRIREYQAELAVIDRQIASATADQARLQSVLADYQAKVDAVPSRESELVELTRDYATLQASYTSLLTKREDSKLAANLESRNIGEQFKILDPASLPERPINPLARLQVILMGSSGGLMLGLLLIALLEYRDTSFKTEEDVTRVLSLPVLALVPVMGRDHTAQARRRRSMVALVLFVAIGSVAVVALWRLQF
jgi:polysaccharide chain length determinant protein (PEP-CTERM system associated)